jgi:hypothetical protein
VKVRDPEASSRRAHRATTCSSSSRVTRRNDPAALQSTVCNSSNRGGRGAFKHHDSTARRPIARFSRDKRTRKTGERKMKPKAGKWCTACRQWLPLQAFAPRAELRSGLDSWCRSCRCERVRQWRVANPAYLEEYNAKRRENYAAEHPRTSRPCIVCGRLHSRKPDALVCSERCRNERRKEQRRDWHERDKNPEPLIE